MDRKSLVAASMAVALSACGGGGGDDGPSFKDPDQAHFTYGAPATASGDAQDAADAGAANVSTALAVVATSDEEAAQDQLLDVATLPNEMGDIFPGSVPEPDLQAPGGAVAAFQARKLVRSQLKSAAALAEWDDPDCWALTATVATFNHCTMTETDDTSTMVVSVDGSFHRLTGHVAWDFTIGANASGTEDGATIRIGFTDRLSGDLAWTASTFDGFSRSDIWLSETDGSRTVSGAVTYNADYDLGYATDPGCITGGTVTLKRLWAEVPVLDDADEEDFADAAVKFTWVPVEDACSTEVTVAWGTPN